MKHYDIAIIGAGTMGWSAAYYLSNKNSKVLLVDPHAAPHAFGSHSGATRIIRKSYYEHPAYVPLLEKSYQLWSDLEQISNLKIYHETGLYYTGEKNCSVITGVKKSSQLYDIPLGYNYPGLFNNIPHEWETIFEPQAGYLDIRNAFVAFQKNSNSSYLNPINEKLLHWNQKKDAIEIHTEQTSYTCDKLIFTAGAWNKNLIPQFNLPFTITKQVLGWIKNVTNKKYFEGQLPCWFLHHPLHGMFYGFPINQAISTDLKFALHMPGEICASPDNYNKTVSDLDQSILREFIQNHWPELNLNTIEYETCLYTYTPDENFVIDFLPNTDQKIIIAGGFSGHGFKFATAVGDILSKLAINEDIDLNLDFLKINRFTNL